MNNILAELPEDVRREVESVGTVVTSDQLDNYGRLKEIENKSHKIKTVLDAWQNQQSEERALRRSFAKLLLTAVFVQIALVNISFFAIGLKYLTVDKWVATSFILAVLADVVAMATIVIKYLFPKPGAEVLELIEKL